MSRFFALFWWALAGLCGVGLRATEIGAKAFLGQRALEMADWEWEVGLMGQDLGSERPAGIVFYELTSTWPLAGGELVAEVEGGRIDDDENTPDRVEDYVFPLNQLREESALKVGKTVWFRRWAEGWRTGVGRFAPESHLDKVSYASDKTGRFIARPFVRPTAVADPGTGLGALVSREFGDGSRILYLVNDANGTARLSPVRTLRGEWFHALEWRARWVPGQVSRVIPWFTERGGREAHGVSASYEVGLGGGWGAFVRGGTEQGGVARTSKLVAGGLEWAPGEDWRLGLALGWGADGADRRRETLSEVYARKELGHGVAAGVHLQTSQRERECADREQETNLTVRLVYTGKIKRSEKAR